MRGSRARHAVPLRQNGTGNGAIGNFKFEITDLKLQRRQRARQNGTGNGAIGNFKFEITDLKFAMREGRASAKFISAGI